MPNWCNNFITFWSDGTPEGNAGLKDLNAKILYVSNLINEWKKMKLFESIENCFSSYCVWECYLAEYGYGLKIATEQRGYITFCDEIDPEHDEHFSIECEDAWSPNLGFWYYLLQYAYSGHITFTYQASEPGMCSYSTNDPCILPRYSGYVVTENLEQLKEFDKIWDNSYNQLFQYLIPGNVFGNTKLFSKYIKHDENFRRMYDENHKLIVEDRLMPSAPSLELYCLEGDEDEVLATLEEYKTLSPNATINNLEDEFKNKDNASCIYFYPWELVEVEEHVECEKYSRTLIKNFMNEETHEVTEEEYGMIQPITANFMYYNGGNNNE